MANKELRRLAKASGVPMWRVAKQIGISEVTLSRWLREELPQEKRELILSIIEELSEQE